MINRTRWTSLPSSHLRLDLYPKYRGSQPVGARQITVEETSDDKLQALFTEMETRDVATTEYSSRTLRSDFTLYHHHSMGKRRIPANMGVILVRRKWQIFVFRLMAYTALVWRKARRVRALRQE